MLPWSVRGAETRKQYLRPEVMKLDDGGAIPEGTLQQAAELKRRGWGEVGAMSYAEFLVWLENNLNDSDHARTGLRAQLMDMDLQAHKGEAKLSWDEVALSYKYRFPVHACGYNWLQSNVDSAEHLKQRINEVIARYNSEGKRCEKVILVTHSMGGLVARYCSEALGMRDKIMGIVHGVMPAIGAPAVYRRFKSGTEDYSAFYNVAAAMGAAVLGNDAAEMTAVLSSAPGPLQLLPGKQYGNKWLHIKDRNYTYSMPMNGDPYNEIYTVRGQWWSMCDDHLMNPLNQERDARAWTRQNEIDWAAFTRIIRNDVAKFHVKIADKYHPNTHAFFGSDETFRAYGNVTWSSTTGLMAATVFKDRKLDVLNARPLTIEELREHKRDDKAGAELKTERHVDASYTDKGWFSKDTLIYRISAPDAPGDGTVPHASGVAPEAFCKSMLRVGVGHEPAYKQSVSPDNLKACQFTLRAIIKIAQEVKTTSLRYD
ncbi:esterase/lipase family protein [Roseateles koreensis]|uniref:GPI inositol-deacylase PGAP1-like alpha/beta domain-containing protein n=1 Tax=Roseateles koreensis TaxID=2987526 RepID=A0ABT5KQY0_9BURK|nr:hypothetical protein [Roseateles koreensis]MDC8785319.1 hypothetical protein [Roseateles koreensis]